MRILNLKEFRDLPDGAVFMKYEPCVFEELSIKVETLEYDFIVQDAVGEVKCNDSGDMAKVLFQAQDDSSFSVGLDLDCVGRDGCFNDEQLFAVYEQKDIDNLIEKLKSCKGL